MVEYGIRTVITRLNGEPLRVLRIYFGPLSYYDWVHYSSPDKMYDLAHIRGLFNKYITRIINESDDNEYTIDNLMEEEDPVKENIIVQIIEKSGFANNEFLMNTVSECRDRSLTLAGAYDTFIFLNTSPDFYSNYLHQDIYSRSQIISMIERMKKFTVESRYRDAISENIEINLVHEPREYETWKHNLKRGKALSEQSSSNNRQNNIQKTAAPVPLDSEIADIITQSQIALSEAIRQAERNPSKTFDFESDEKEFGEIG